MLLRNRINEFHADNPVTGSYFGASITVPMVDTARYTVLNRLTTLNVLNHAAVRVTSFDRYRKHRKQQQVNFMAFSVQPASRSPTK